VDLGPDGRHREPRLLNVINIARVSGSSDQRGGMTGGRPINVPTAASTPRTASTHAVSKRIRRRYLYRSGCGIAPRDQIVAPILYHDSERTPIRGRANR
jgi:hypothetical protein